MPEPVFWVWDSAEPAADFDAVPVRPSRSTFEADVAAFFEVTFCVPVCDSALPAAVLEELPAELLESTDDAFAATRALVDFVDFEAMDLLNRMWCVVL